MMSLYATDGSINVTVVDGSSFTGVHATDGSINVQKAPSPVTAPISATAPCGAWYVTKTAVDVSSIKSPDGSLYVSVSPYVKTARRVTVVSGSL